MKKGLIDPNTVVYQLIGWQAPAKEGDPYMPILQEIPNSDRLAEVVNLQFDVAPPLFWIDCPDEAVADQWYFDNQTMECLPIPPGPPMPTGAITL